MNCDDENPRAELYKNRIHYSLPVRIGNWNDALAIEEDKLNMTAYKKTHCQMLVAKTRSMLRNVLEPVALSTAIVNLDYGGLYQIYAADLPNTLQPVVPQTKGLYLSGMINERDLEYSTDFMHGCTVTASPDKIACLRNTFFFTNSEGKTGTINYGEDLYIQLYTPHDNVSALYLQAECETMDTFGSHLIVRLSRIPDVYCHFKIIHWNKSLRKDSLGSKIIPDAAIIIQHMASGRNLVAENDKWIPSFFGAECVVSCHTILDQNRGETAQNMWKIFGKRETDKGAIIRAAKGEDIAPDLLE